MSVESWARRASGLLVPRMGFADHPLGRFQPCVGPCCGCTLLADPPPTLWVDLPNLGPGCCANFEATFEVTLDPGITEIGGAPAQQWDLEISPAICGPVVETLQVIAQDLGALCRMTVNLLMPNLAHFLQWRYDSYSSFPDPINESISYAAQQAAPCSGVGTTVHVYEAAP